MNASCAIDARERHHHHDRAHHEDRDERIPRDDRRDAPRPTNTPNHARLGGGAPTYAREKRHRRDRAQHERPPS